MVAVDDVEVRDESTPAPDPTVTALTPADGATVPASAFDLTWERVVDPGFIVLSQEVTIAASADLTATPVRYNPTGMSQTVPTTLLSPGTTWWWQVSVVFARSATAPAESVVTEVRSFTVEEADASTDPGEDAGGSDAGGDTGEDTGGDTGEGTGEETVGIDLGGEVPGGGDTVGVTVVDTSALPSTGGDTGLWPLAGAGAMLIGALLLALSRRARRDER